MHRNKPEATPARVGSREDALAEFMRSGHAFYRFRSTQRRQEIEDILLGSKLFFSGVDAHSQDDIYEGKPILRWDHVIPSFEEVVALVRRNTQRKPEEDKRAQARMIHSQMLDADQRSCLQAWIEVDTQRMFAQSSICCFTKNPFVQRRWAEYANRGTGYVLVFNFAAGWPMHSLSGHRPIPMVPMAVTYLPGNLRPVVTLSFRRDDQANGWDYLEKGLLTKPSTWHDQEEHRVIRMAIGPGQVPFPSHLLVGILLGYHISDEDHDLIRQVNGRRNAPLAIYKATPSNDEDAHIRFQPAP